MSPMSVAARACGLCIFGLTVASVLDHQVWSNVPRNLDVADLFSGVASVSLAAREHARQASTFDIKDSKDQDICSETGFRMAMTLVLGVRENGLVAIAPVCSSFVCLNCWNTKRNKNNYAGDESYTPVKVGNFIARASAFLLCLAVARGVHVILENPASSMLFSFLQPSLSCIPGLQFIITHRCVWSTERYGMRYKKAFKFMATGPWLKPVEQKCQCPSQKDSSCHKPLVRLDAKGRRYGLLKNLLESASYPTNLGFALVEAWLAAPPVYVALAMENIRTPSKRKAGQESQDPWPADPKEGESEEAWPEGEHDELSKPVVAQPVVTDDEWAWSEGEMEKVKKDNRAKVAKSDNKRPRPQDTKDDPWPEDDKDDSELLAWPGDW